MSDLVERLRSCPSFTECKKSAAEIERLSAQVERLAEALEDAGEYISGDVENEFGPAIRLTEKIKSALSSTESRDA